MTAWLDRAIRLALVVAYRGLRVYWYLARPHTHGVYVALWSRGELLLIRNSYRTPASVPGGALKSGEDRAVAAARELVEEVGVPVDPDRLAQFSQYTVNEFHHSDTVSVFEVDFGAERPAFEIDRREVVWAGYVAVNDVLAMNLATVVRLYLEEKAPPALESSPSMLRAPPEP